MDDSFDKCYGKQNKIDHHEDKQKENTNREVDYQETDIVDLSKSLLIFNKDK